MTEKKRERNQKQILNIIKLKGKGKFKLIETQQENENTQNLKRSSKKDDLSICGKKYETTLTEGWLQCPFGCNWAQDQLS